MNKHQETLITIMFFSKKADYQQKEATSNRKLDMTVRNIIPNNQALTWFDDEYSPKPDEY